MYGIRYTKQTRKKMKRRLHPSEQTKNRTHAKFDHDNFLPRPLSSLIFLAIFPKQTLKKNHFLSFFYLPQRSLLCSTKLSSPKRPEASLALPHWIPLCSQTEREKIVIVRRFHSPKPSPNQITTKKSKHLFLNADFDIINKSNSIYIFFDISQQK